MLHLPRAPLMLGSGLQYMQLKVPLVSYVMGVWWHQHHRETGRSSSPALFGAVFWRLFWRLYEIINILRSHKKQPADENPALITTIKLCLGFKGEVWVSQQ